MTLLLSIEWSSDGVASRIVDVAAQSLLADSCATHHPAGEGHDVERWLRTTISTTRAAVDSLAAVGLTASDLRSIEVHSTSPGGLVALDASGAPLHDALLGTHAESGADAEWLVGQADGGADAWLAATGVLPTAGSTVSLLSFLHRTDSASWDAMARCTLPIGLLAERLGGRPAISAHDATGTAVADRRAPNTWCTDLLRVVDDARDWNATMPAIVDTATPIGVLDGAIADSLGIPAGTPLHIGSMRAA